MKYLLIILSFLGLIDALYLTYEHYSPIIAPCVSTSLLDCGEVLNSKYSVIFGVPMALFGVIQYLLLLILGVLIIKKNNTLYKNIYVIFASWGAIFSLYLIYIQYFVIGKICLYCTFSALISLGIFVIAAKFLKWHFKVVALSVYEIIYKHIVKNLLFLFDPYTVHETMLNIGHKAGNSNISKKLFDFLINYEDKKLHKKFAGIKFKNPIGLAAGFDYQAKLTGIMPHLGFGFGTIGTITNLPCPGNPYPQLGRLPKSKSLWVNKGFNNPGADAIIKGLRGIKFSYPVGVSIGRTNIDKINSIEKSINDIVSAFIKFKKAKLNHSYYELNISCPNLKGGLDFYNTRDLTKLMLAVDDVNPDKPYFVKMPIEHNDKKFEELLSVIDKSKAVGLIIGNLQKDRKHPELNQEEVKKFEKGNFSGRPTFERSNELIKLTRKKYKNRFVIIGCGGVFGIEDALEKSRNGADLVQLITGMVFTGPQIAARINAGLVDKSL